jgi:hypothetical protein
MLPPRNGWTFAALSTLFCAVFGVFGEDLSDFFSCCCAINSDGGEWIPDVVLFCCSVLSDFLDPGIICDFDVIFGVFDAGLEAAPVCDLDVIFGVFDARLEAAPVCDLDVIFGVFDAGLEAALICDFDIIFGIFEATRFLATTRRRVGFRVDLGINVRGSDMNGVRVGLAFKIRSTV